MFTDDCTGIALWPDSDDDDEDLPLSPQMRRRVQDWVDEYTEAVAQTGMPPVDAVDHDLRGYELSIAVQEDLGHDFDVVYHFGTREARGLVRDYRA